VDPDVGEKVPASHAGHCESDSPGVLDAVPAVQLVQLICPDSVPPVVPGGQGMQPTESE
jgi:hypothetical protein